MEHKLDQINIAPTLTGKFGRMWQVDLPAALKARGIDQSKDAALLSLLVEAPDAHPFWHSYWLALIHLRPMEGVTHETTFYLPDATHELWVAALSPDVPREQQIRTGMFAPMSPLNFAAQMKVTDEEAKALVLKAATDIINGTLSPDTDFIQLWVARFGDSMMKEKRPKQ